jgi:hypothetical protein
MIDRVFSQFPANSVLAGSELAGQVLGDAFVSSGKAVISDQVRGSLFEDQSTTGGGDVEKPTPTETPTLANTGVNSFEYTQLLVSVSVILIFAGLLVLLKKRVTK